MSFEINDRRAALLAALLGSMLAAQPTLAQRVDDNAVRGANDAFGTTIGNENIGLYNPYDVRGFSAIDAGNARIDGLYFDQLIDPVSHLIDRTTIHVGISAQGYPLPAPTGIVEYALSRAGTKRVTSLVASIGPFGAADFEADLHMPLIQDRLSLVAGGTISRTDDGYGAQGSYANVALMPRWTPRPNIEVIGFASGSWAWGEQSQPAIFVAGNYLPPRIARGRFFGQRWERNSNTGTNFGGLATINLGATTLRGGIFRSSFVENRNFDDLFLDVDPAGIGREMVIADSGVRSASTSGELRLSRKFEGKSSPQTLHFIVRARDQRRLYGGSDIIELGLGNIDVYRPRPEPLLIIGPKTTDHIRQQVVALAYTGRLFQRLELNAGVQKSFYRKDTVEPGTIASISGRSRPLMYNLAMAFRATQRLALYGSYTQGLEEGGVAPANAINKDSASPALRTRQIDAGLRYSLHDDLLLVLGAFEVRKPYFNLDQASLYRQLGEVRQSGVEMSLVGTLLPGLHVVIGNLFLRPRIVGEEVNAGLIGSRPVGQTSRLTIASFDYDIPTWKGFSLDATLTSTGDRIASSDNRLRIPARSVIDVGARYHFKAGSAPASLVVRIGNIFNTFGWRTNGSGVFVPNAQRRISASIAVDL